MTPQELLQIIKGLPFIDNSFEPKLLLTFVSSLRANIGKNKFLNLKEYLIPKNAGALYKEFSNNSYSEPNSNILDLQLEIQVKAAISRIIKKHEEWSPLFSIPIEWRELTTGEISLTNPILPQYIYLGKSAFQNEVLLEETIVHEMSHVWCGFITEIFDFQTPIASYNLTLPSGTQGKGPRGVLLAALFAAAALNFYHISNKVLSGCEERVTYIRRYLDGCIQTLNICEGISTIGVLINSHLSLFLKEHLLLTQGKIYA